MTAYEIPLIPASQRFTIQLAGVTYQLRVWWNDADQGGWILDIFNNVGNPILRGVPLTASKDLLAQYAYLKFGGQLFVQTDHAQGTPPTYANLGINAHLYFVTNP